MCCVGIKQQIYCTAPVVNRRVILYVLLLFRYRNVPRPPRGWGKITTIVHVQEGTAHN